MLAAIALLTIGALDFTNVSGVKVSCLENIRGKAGRARVEIVVGTGALQESDNEQGVAHLLEHLVMRPLGFDHQNAATGWDYTSYYRDVRAVELSTATVDLLDALSSARFTNADFELEREVVLRELEKRGSRDAMMVDPLFGGTILSRDPGGSLESVRSLTADDVRRFHKEHYITGNIAVVLRGAVSCDEQKKRLEPILARFAPGGAVAVPAVDRDEPGPRALSSSLNGDFVQGYYWYRSTLEEELILQIVGKHLEQRALAELRKAKGLTYSPQSHFQRLAGGGSVSISVTTDGQERIVADWYDRTILELKTSPKPTQVTKSALTFVSDTLENDAVRSSLAAIRGERQAEQILRELTDDRMKGLLSKLLDENRSFGSSTPTTNITSIIILVLFGVIVLGVIGFVGLKLARGR